MGIRGLTTYIAEKSDFSFEPYHLKNCHLVIDGNCVASQLYVREFSGSKRGRCAFGGDYDEYARAAKRFFCQLSCCFIKSIVIFDGGREPRKQVTHWARLKSKIAAATRATPSNCSECNLPLLMLEVFRWVATQSGAVVAQCYFEADEEIAALSRALSCPLLSYDSDFYIHAVPCYIPFPTLATKLTEEISQENSSRRCVERYVECRVFNVNKFLSRINVGEWRKKSGGEKNILQVEVLPLVAALLGNDYVKRKTFQNFFSQIQLPNKSSTCGRIVGLLEWLRLEESLDSAIKKILNHAKKGKREYLEKVIRQTVDVYVGNPSQLFQQLNLSSDCEVKNISIDAVDSSDHLEVLATGVGDKSSVTENESASEVLDESDHTKGLSDEPSAPSGNTEDLDQFSIEEDDCGHSSDSQSTSEDSNSEDEEDQVCWWNERVKNLPSWFTERYQRCELPPSFMDIMVRRMYLCPPQVEDHSQPHSHEISFPILRAIVRLLTPENDEPLICWTRDNKHAVSLPLKPLPKQPSWPSPENILYTPRNALVEVLLQAMNLFSENKHENKERKLAFNSVPSDWRLLALCLAYWLRFSPEKKVDERHLISACFCAVILRVVDVRAGPPGQKSSKVRKEKKKESAEQKNRYSVPPFDKKLEEAKEVRGNVTNPEKINDPFTPPIPENLMGELKSVRPTMKQLLQFVSTDECIRVAESEGLVFQMRQIDGGSKRQTFVGGRNIQRLRPFSFNVSAVHAFSELQSVLFHVTHLNYLLGEPLVPSALHTSFTGTLAYNAHYRTHSKSGTSRQTLWQRLLGTSAPSLENFLEEFFVCVIKLAMGKDDAESNTWNKSRQKKRNKKTADERVQKVVNQNVESREKSKETFFDAGNKFSLLGSGD